MTDPTDKDDPKAANADPKRADPKRADPNRTSVAVGGDRTGTAKRSGRVSYDSRGNPTWEWQLETGVYSRDANTQRLKKLDLGDLSIAESAVQKRPPGLGANKLPAATKKQLPGGGFNPYDSSSTGSASASSPHDSAPARDVTTARAATKSTTAPRKPAPAPKESAWSKLKQLVKGKKTDEDDSDYE
jgi:hypothetical protein